MHASRARRARASRSGSCRRQLDQLCGPERDAYVDSGPQSFQTKTLPTATPEQPDRPHFQPAPSESAPAWHDELRQKRTIYVTIGTVQTDLTAGRTIHDALEDVDSAVSVTIGPANDPRLRDPVPGQGARLTLRAASLPERQLRRRRRPKRLRLDASHPRTQSAVAPAPPRGRPDRERRSPRRARRGA